MKMCVLVLSAIGFAPPVSAEDWPQFRGPKSEGNYKGPELPIEWGTEKNLVWKTTIPGHGWSSPIVWKGKIYLTTAVEDKGNFSLQALCVDSKNGEIAWQKEIFVENPKEAPKPHSKNSHASPTPVTDGERLYVHFGHMGTAALDLEGVILWKNDKLKYKPQHGNGGSPILAGDNLIFSMDGSDQQQVVALNKKTGDLQWKTDRRSTAVQKFSFSTPLLLKTNGGEQVISAASGFVASYDPKSGAELWRFNYPVPGYSVIPQPVAGNGLVYLSTSYNTPVMLAIKPEGTGDITKSNLAWSAKKGAPHTPSPLLVGKEIYTLSDAGMLTCSDALDGTVHWTERVAAGCSSSPIHSNGKIYLTSEAGVGRVIAASKEFKELASNDLKEKTFATFAAVDGSLYIRTMTQLYRFQNK